MTTFQTRPTVQKVYLCLCWFYGNGNLFEKLANSRLVGQCRPSHAYNQPIKIEFHLIFRFFLFKTFFYCEIFLELSQNINMIRFYISIKEFTLIFLVTNQICLNWMSVRLATHYLETKVNGNAHAAAIPHLVACFTAAATANTPRNKHTNAAYYSVHLCAG